MEGKLYKPGEISELQRELKKIYDGWFGSIDKPTQSFVNFMITELHKDGYKIIKVK